MRARWWMLSGWLLSTACNGTDPEPTCLDDIGVLCTLAGTGEQGFAGDGEAAREATLSFPIDVAFAPDGALHIADWNNGRIRRIDPDTGLIDTIAGSGDLCTQSDPLGLSARDVCLNHPSDLDFTASGEMLIAGWFNSQVFAVDLESGVVTGVLGTGARGYDGEDGPAADAVFDTVASTAPDPAGGLYLMDQQNQIIRRVDADGGIELHAGRCVVEWDDTGAAPCAADQDPVACPDSDKLTCGDPAATCAYPCTPAFAGDGGPALGMRMGQPHGAQAVPSGQLALAADGTLYFSDPLNGRVRAIDPDGVVRTVVDGLDEPADLALAPDGSLFVADLYDNCIVRVAPGGAMDTVAGACGSDHDLAVDGTIATAAQLYFPFGVAFEDGVLTFTETGNHLVRAVRLE